MTGGKYITIFVLSLALLLCVAYGKKDENCCEITNKLLQRFKLDPHRDLEEVDHTFDRPENVLLSQPKKKFDEGILYASHRSGKVERLNLDTGAVDYLGQNMGVPNGIAFDSKDNIIVCNVLAIGLGATYNGTVWTMDKDGNNQRALVWKLGSAFNHVHVTKRKGKDLYWIAVTTQGTGPADGYVSVADEDGNMKILATNLIAANEVNVHDDYLYVIETRGFLVRRFRIDYGQGKSVNDISLHDSEVYAYFGYGTYLDGMKFDACGNLWVTLVHKHGIAVVSPDREINIVYEEPIPNFDTVVHELLNGTRSVGNVEIDFANPNAAFQFPTSVAFGGYNLDTVYVASLFSKVATFKLPIPGEPLLHN